MTGEVWLFFFFFLRFQHFEMADEFAALEELTWDSKLLLLLLPMYRSILGNYNIRSL